MHEERAILESFGHEVVPFCRAHPEDPAVKFSRHFPPHFDPSRLRPSVSGLRDLREFFYSRRAAEALAELLDDWHPALAHAHNIYGRLTGAVLDVLHRRGIPTVLTLHDYKVLCPSYLLLSHGQVCERCQGHKFYHAFLQACHKGSRLSSTLYALESYLNAWRGSYRDKVGLFISPSMFLRDKMLEFGWPAEKVVAVPNFVDPDKFAPVYQPGDYFLYLGRLSAEKGVGTLLGAFKGLSTGSQLKIAGTGPERSKLQVQAADDPRIEFCGHLSGAQLQQTVAGARALVIPSEWYENAPMSVLEAMAYGKPVLGADIGGISEQVQDGVTGRLFRAGDRNALHACLVEIQEAPVSRLVDMGKAARQRVESLYSPAVHYRHLVDVYSRVLGRSNV